MRHYSIYLVIIFFGCALLFQSRITNVIDKVTLADRLKYLPSGTFLKGAALSYDAELSDLLWIKALAYFGDQYVSGHDYSWLYHILDTATTLDSYFEDPYEFGGIVLANEVGDVEKSTMLLKKGMQNVPRTHRRYWYLPFFLAYNYWYFQKDYKTGAKYLEIASRYPQAPSYLPLLTARMYADASNADMALPFLDEMIRSARTAERKTQLERRRKEVLVNRDLDMLDQAVLAYKRQIGSYPASLEDLVTEGIIDTIPVEPFGGRYVYDPLLQKVRSTRSGRIKVFKPKI